jgi:hypothetical protein
VDGEVLADRTPSRGGGQRELWRSRYLKFIAFANDSSWTDVLGTRQKAPEDRSLTKTKVTSQSQILSAT